MEPSLDDWIAAVIPLAPPPTIITSYCGVAQLNKVIVITQSIKKNHVLYNCLRLINYETKNICKKFNVKCYPLDEEINFSESDDFYDEAHMRPSGNKKVAEYIAKNIEHEIS